MTKKDWRNLKIGQTVYYGPNRTPRVVKDVSINNSVTFDTLHKTKSGCPETFYSKNERRLFHLKHN